MAKSRLEEGSKNRRKSKPDNLKNVETPEEESDISDTDKFSDDEEGGIRIDDIYIPPAPPPVCSYESSGPRLIITQIVNENFKSYAGRVVVGPFDKSFSSIVGPNGSGKSNVIDSMLFVFGYRATKIRSKKVSVLIHKSERHQNVSSCKVEVHFVQITDQENGQYEKIPNSEFVISRTAFQNSSSFYEINNKRVQFKEVAMTLRKHGIDLIHNRFLILQGEVEQIALMKPKAQHPHETGMLEYLEDIIGTTRFKEPLEKLQARIETLNEERQEKLNRLKVVESEREALRRPMQETVDFLKTENRITSLKNKKFQLQLYKIQKLIDETENEKSEVEGVLKSLNDKLKELQDQKGNEKSEMDAIKKFLNKTTKKYEEFGALKQNAEKKNTGLLEEGKQLKKNYKKTLENLNTEEDKLKTLLKVPEKNQKEIKKLTEEEVVLDEKRKEEEAAFQTVMSSLQKETKNFQEEKDKLQTEQIKLKKKYDEMRSAYELAKSERDIYTSSEQTEKAKLDQLVQKLNEMKETLETREKELADLKKILPQKESEYQRAEERLKAIKTKATEITSNLRKHQSQLEEKKCSMSANRSRSRVLDYLMRLKMEGKIPGIFGRLGDLGAIDEKYDIAVSTACFSLDYILVDHSDTIAPCVEALKRDGVGRATFLALNKISHHYHNQKKSNFKAPESVHRLFDLIRVEDERVLPAFYYALRNTLVANNLEQASRIAYGSTRHRVVTLMGELIEVSGTMSGGGKQVMKGKMGSSVSVSTDTYSAEEINDLERTVDRMEECLQDCRQMEQSTEEIIRTVCPEINAMKMNMNKWTIEIQGLSKQVPELETQVKDQKKKVKECAPNAKKLKELSDKVDLTEKGARKAEIEASVIEEKVNVVHEKIMEITGGKTKEAQGKLDEVTKKWEKTRTTITQLQVAIKTSERNAKKAQERIDNMKTELEEAEKREREIQKEKETVENDCKMASNKMEELKTEIDENTEKLKELEEEHKNYMQEVNNVKASKVKEEQKMEGIEKKLAETKRDIPTVQAKLEKLDLHKIPVFREPENEFAEENAEGLGSNDVQQPVEETELINYEEETLSQISSSEINANLQREEEYLKTLTPNLNTLKDYEKKTLQYMERSDELKEITERRNICRRGYDEARKNRLEEFMSGFSIISNKLKELYQMLTMGGDAELDLQDSLDPFTEGINFCVRPPKKSWKNITNLSGGEKTLSSLALVFALHYYRPTPLYVMDEIDAALDFKNVSIVGYYIKERTKNAQFIVISLRTNMFELAHMLTGIFKISNCTKTITICPDNYCKKPDVSPPKTSESSVPPAAKNTLNTRKRSSNCFKEVEQKSGVMPLDPKSSENVSPPKTPLTKEAKKLKPRTAKKSLELNDETNRNESDLHSNDSEKRDERKKRVRESSASSEESNKENKSDGFDPLDIDCDPNESELLRQDKENRSRSSRHI